MSRLPGKRARPVLRGPGRGNALRLPDERWFAELQRRCLDRGVFCSVEHLTTALHDWIDAWNDNPRPFIWRKTADQIIDRICHYCSRISGPAH
ncbi:hypothetical protein [Nonomuraea monospora]|uniref:hypothetical protein n=1 Tax=Nonomuraea monospora TaxID=568818 RepID=UPI0031DE2FFC